MSSSSLPEHGPAAQRPSLVEIGGSFGEPVPCAGNRPLRLDDPNTAWIVEQGTVDVFAVEYESDRTASTFKHMIRARRGRLLFGENAGDSGLRLVAKGLPGAMVRPAPLAELLERLREETADTALTEQVDAWVHEFAEAIARDIDPRPRADSLLGTESATTVSGVVSSERGVVWLDGRGAQAAYLGTEEAGSGPSGAMPVSPGTWVTLPEPAKVEGLSSADMSPADLLLLHLPEFHRLALAAESLNRLLLLADETNLQRDRTTWRRSDKAASRDRLFSVIDDFRQEYDASSGLVAALQIVCAYEGIPLRAPETAQEKEDLDALLTASGLRARSVRLEEEDRWWYGDSGAIIASRKDDGQPVALLPGRLGWYRCVDPLSGESRRVTARAAAGFDAEAVMVYRPLPTDRQVGPSDLLRLACRNQMQDFVQVMLAGTAAGAVMLFPAAALGLLADTLIPSGEPGRLVHLTGLLLLAAIVTGFLNMLRGTAMMRIEGRAATRIVSGVWDRLLRLRAKFFRRFTAGDLSTRAMTFLTMRDQVSAVASGAILSVLFLLPTFALVFLYNTALGWLCLVLGIVTLGLTVALGAIQIKHHRRRFAAARALAGHLFQLINGVGKLQATGAEPSAYAWWARQYRDQKLAEIGISRPSEHLASIAYSIPALWTAALIVVALAQDPAQLAVGDFLVVYAASMMFVGSLAVVGVSAEAITALIPAGEQSREIMEALPEDGAREGTVTRLHGDLVFDRISFRYSETGPLILDDVTIHARSGEFIAIVGESGSGKSTLMRLALGLETPSSGTVYYDGHDLARLNPDSVRRQLGIVMQENSLLSGTVMDNINGVDASLTLDDAWRAAGQAAVADDIAEMPMGMHTPMGGTGSTFSGGQQQRIRIAAALVRRPSILFLDEATSWLDAKSQALTMEGIERANATRIVIAHRISTIRHASRIYVLQAGKVVQQGTFEQLSESDGLFRRFVERQSA